MKDSKDFCATFLPEFLTDFNGTCMLFRLVGLMNLIFILSLSVFKGENCLYVIL